MSRDWIVFILTQLATSLWSIAIYKSIISLGMYNAVPCDCVCPDGKYDRALSLIVSVLCFLGIYSVLKIPIAWVVDRFVKDERDSGDEFFNSEN